MLYVFRVAMAQAPPTGCQPGNWIAVAVMVTTAPRVRAVAGTLSGWWRVRGRMAENNGRTSSRPSPATLRALAAQNTPEVRKEARRYAEQRVPLLRAAFVPVSHRTPTELVDDAITDTWLGEGDPWNPDECDLVTHLRGLIRKRTWQEARHRTRIRSQPFDLGDGTVEDVLARERPHASRGDITPIMFASVIATVAVELRKVDPTDEAATEITWCWELGYFERREVMALTGMDENTHKTARNRLLSRRKHLPPSLIAFVEDLLDRSA